MSRRGKAAPSVGSADGSAVRRPNCAVSRGAWQAVSVGYDTAWRLVYCAIGTPPDWLAGAGVGLIGAFSVGMAGWLAGLTGAA